MRGIGFIGGEGPGYEQSAILAKGADLIAAADSGLLAAEAAGLRPDWIVGDMDSLGELSRLDRYPPDRVLRYPSDKDYTDTELLLSLLWEQGCDELWLLGGGGGRTDHLLAIQALFEREKSPDRWITAAEDIRQVRAGHPLEVAGAQAVSGGQAPGSLVSVFPLGIGPWELESRGLKWPLSGLPWERGFFGLSNVALEGDFMIRAIRGRFLVVLPR
ncbi:thiamine diphosphokinase [Treponema primitia ZAS-2]|uniref:Thiamine diphosphokinase n=1 Tax=Treponema primitia (strain ATCC BAA-887 / DSM 12427 / ZAS-2) TaxID=545694 RepID=F5YR50_TREPZ|nr:thiamine diphosphokinase [Treponema primitia]AEF84196.1 thiamine diphosphokinase [Treponema primitia ZAS-2]